jgi:hypothetical protein
MGFGQVHLPNEVLQQSAEDGVDHKLFRAPEEQFAR